MKRKSIKDSLASKGLYDDSSGKERELKILEGFMQRLQFSSFKITAGESPDFLLNFSLNEYSATVGCEITFYFADDQKHGSAQARFIHQWKNFAKSLREELNTQNKEFEFLYGAIHFSYPSFEILDQIDQHAFIQEIIRAVKEKKDVENIENYNVEHFPLLATHVHHIYLMNTRPETRTLWWPAHLQAGGIVDPIDRLIEIVKVKNSGAYKYDWKGASEKWLLIYSGTEGLLDLVGVYTNPEIHNRLGK